MVSIPGAFPARPEAAGETQDPEESSQGTGAIDCFGPGGRPRDMGTELREDNLSCMLCVVWGAQRENWGLEAVLS